MFDFPPAFIERQKQEHDQSRQQKADRPFSQRRQSRAGIHPIIILLLRRAVTQIKEKQAAAEKEKQDRIGDDRFTDQKKFYRSQQH